MLNTNCRAIRSCNFRNICNETGCPRFFGATLYIETVYLKLWTVCYWIHRASNGQWWEKSLFVEIKRKCRKDRIFLIYIRFFRYLFNTYLNSIIWYLARLQTCSIILFNLEFCLSVKLLNLVQFFYRLMYINNANMNQSQLICQHEIILQEMNTVFSVATTA